MEKLSYQILKEQNYKGYLLREAPERVLQLISVPLPFIREGSYR